MSMITRVKITCTLIALICVSAWLFVVLLSTAHQSIRDVHLLAFIPSKSSSFQSLSWMSDDKNISSSPITAFPDTVDFNKKNVAFHINKSMPWLHYYASSNHVLENYFFHGYYQGDSKYHKRFTHSVLVILPFFFDQKDLMRTCINRVSLEQGIAVSHQNSMSGRWHWETSSQGLANFKSKYKIFYGQASSGLCFQKMTGRTGHSDNGDFLGNLPKHNDDYANTMTNFIQNIRSSQQPSNNYLKTGNNKDENDMSQKTDITNCGQILLLQHPVSGAIEEYWKMFSREVNCVDKISQHKDKDIDKIVTWIKNRGNNILKHLLFHPKICSQAFSQHLRQNKSSYKIANEKNQTSINYIKNENFTNMSDRENSTININKYFNYGERNSIYHAASPCDKNVNLFLEELDLDERNYLVNYIVENLSSLFSMVALYEDLEKSLKMIDIVHHFSVSDCIHQQQYKGLDSFSAPTIKNVRSSFLLNEQVHLANDNTTEQVQPANENTAMYQDSDPVMAKNLNFHSQDTISKGQQLIFQDLKEEKNTKVESSVRNNINENDSILSKQVAEEHIDDNEETKYDKKQPIQADNSREQNRISKTQASSILGGRMKICNEVGDFHFQQLFQRLNTNKIVHDSLALDLKIYKEVKKLYQFQKKMVFNTLKA